MIFLYIADKLLVNKTILFISLIAAALIGWLSHFYMQPTHSILVNEIETPESEHNVQSAKSGNPEDASAKLNKLQSRLQQEVELRVKIEAKVAELESRLNAMQGINPQASESFENNDTPRDPVQITQQPGLNSNNLLAAGVDFTLADELVAQWNQHQLRQLELRDIATREGWLDSDEYREQAKNLRDNQINLRDELSDKQFEQYLYDTGQDNRVAINSVIQGSAAQSIGLRTGDMILSYAGENIYLSREIQNSSRGGIRDELVLIGIQRGQEYLELYIPRGPLGIMLESERIEPD